MDYPDSVRFLYSLGNEVPTAKLGLNRIRLLLEELGKPHHSCRFVHVAGTNGKGSTCAMIESALRTSGFRTGLFTSPHLIEPTERIQVDGRPISPQQFAAAFDEVHAAAERLLQREEIERHPTYFETVTAMAFLTFRCLGVERAVLEVGLGGRLDATNVVMPEITVITPVDFDHEAYLGKSLEAIASEKAGILKAGVPAVFARQRPEVEATLDRCAASAGSPVMKTGSWKVEELLAHPRGCSFRAVGRQTLRLVCPLAGMHQVENSLTAAVALDTLAISRGAIEAGIRSARWPGRLERVHENPEIILDGAHNPSGARALAAYIERFYTGRRVWIIFGGMRDKAVAEMAAILFPLASEVIATAPRQARAVRPETIRELADHPSLRLAPSLGEALELVSGAGSEDAVFITGSLFLVGEAEALLAQADEPLKAVRSLER